MTESRIADHLAEAIKTASAEDIAESIERDEVARKTPQPTEREMRMRERKYTWLFEWPPRNPDDPNAPPPKTTATLTSTIPSVGTRRKIGIFRARLFGGVPFESLDPFTREIGLILSRFHYCLDASANPKDHWARKDLDDVDDYEMLQAIYEEVMAHEATFLGQR